MRRGGACCAWHPSLLCLPLPLPEAFHFHLGVAARHAVYTSAHIPAQPGPGFLGSHDRALVATETRAGSGTEEQGRVVPIKQTKGTQP